ncbi:MAG: lysophospholipase [Timaviella obliquedivisa GSE-PSE-MK23-08B]|jgi:lysophospholipase L1-like esterase|nr:lysophospholipase [Timaviella obliquedivisa GSE-PSE-MK23-08B]
MSSLCLVAASLITHGQAPGWQLAVPKKTFSFLPIGADKSTSQLCDINPHSPISRAAVYEAAVFRPEFSQRGRNSATSALFPHRPTSGGQLYQQRLTALRQGVTYTRLASNSFRSEWLTSIVQPTYSQWKKLLSREAKMMAVGQGRSRLTVILGDSHALWFPIDRLSKDRFWLNQGLSGDTTSGVLKRVSTFAETRPDTIHVMVGINDLRKGKTDKEILINLQQIMQRLRQQHPAAQIFVHSILPTRLTAIPSNRVRWLNYNISALTKQEAVNYLNLQPAFTDADGNLRRALTTDGVHLNVQGYQVWQTASAPIL